jgi:hypothetical protein
MAAMASWYSRDRYSNGSNMTAKAKKRRTDLGHDRRNKTMSLRPIGTRFTQVEQHEGGTLSIDYRVAAYERLDAVQDVRGTLGNVELVTQEPTVEILEVIAAKLVPDPGSGTAAISVAAR